MAGMEAAFSNMGAEMLSQAKSYVTANDGKQWEHLAGQGIVALHVTHSNLQRRMIEIRFDMHLTVEDVKHKLHRHSGTPAFSQRLILKDGGVPIANLDDDSKMLGYYSPESGMELHIIDTDPFSMSRGGGLEDESQVQKYRMSEEDYDKRQGTVRDWIKQQKLKDPNWQPPKPKMGMGNPWAKQDPAAAAAAAAAEAAAAEVDLGPESVKGVEVGMRCECQPGGRRGEVAFVGEVPKLGLGGGFWVGVRFDEPVGKSDGTVKKERIFECEPRYGGFLRGCKIEVGDFPEMGLDLEDSEDEDEI